MQKEKQMKLEGGQVVVIRRSRGMGLVNVCQARDAGAEVTIAGRSQDKLSRPSRSWGRCTRSRWI